MSDPLSSIPPDEALAALQNAVRDRLVADAWYSGIPIFTPDDVTSAGRTETPADIRQRVTQALGAIRGGICILVSAPLLSDFAPDAPDVYAERAALLVRIVELPSVNRAVSGTRKPAGVAGLHTLRRLWHHVFLGATLVPVTAGLVPSDIEGALVWDIVYRTRLDLASTTVTEESTP